MDPATRLLPLPIRVHPFGGESVDSYATRLARANFTTADDIEQALRESGHLSTKRRDHPERARVWRALGATHPTMFAVPSILGGDWVTERRLCAKCSRAQVARGRLPQTGRVCLKHRRWLDHPQIDVSEHRDIVRAEERYRRDLATRAVMFDSPIMAEAMRCAIASGDPDQIGTATTDRALPLEAVLYPAQVTFATFLCSPAFLGPVVRPSDAARAAQRRHIDEVAHAATQDASSPEPERAVSRLQHVAYTLERFVANNKPDLAPPHGDRWNLLRLAPE